jgi:hypothetical protein
MPKHIIKKKGHLIKGDVEFTVTREVQFFGVATACVHSDEYKVATFPTVEQAADCARMHFQKSNNNMELYNVYRHTKGKIRYNTGHFEKINWPDYESRNTRRLRNNARPEGN